MDIIEATKIIESGVIFISQDYKIVEKESTKLLINVLDECRAIHSAWLVMSFPLQEDIIEKATMIQMLNKQIQKKLEKLYWFYSRHYDIKFDDGDWGDENSEFSETWRRNKSIENNISLICETVESWSEQCSIGDLFL